MITVSPHKFGRRVVAIWRTVNRRDAVAAKLIEREAAFPRTREQARQCRALQREVAKLNARAERQARKLAVQG
jgi:hypothetical protein